MRILLMHEDTRGPGQGGGAESMLRDLTKALKDLGNDVAWLHSDNLPEAIDTFKPDIIQVGTIFNKMGWRPIQWLQDNHIPHIQACMDYYQFCGGRMLLRNWDEGCTAVKGVCDNNCVEKHAPAEWLDIVNRSPVLALNDYTADIYRRNGMRADYVGELGVDTDFFYPAEREGCEIYTSSAWAEYPAKGMKYLQQAIDGTDIKVKLMTHLSREQVAEGLRKASIFVFPSTYEETWGLCLQEALASGCACIASDVAGPRAQIHEGMGVLVPPRDPMAIRQAIYLLQSDKAARDEMGLKAREHVVKDHTLEAMGKRYLEIYVDVLKKVL
jgi:Glycosyl transferases group 1